MKTFPRTGTSAKPSRLRALLHVLLRITPALPHAVVSGFPDDEGNSVEVVRSLARHVPVFWRVSEPPDQLSWLVEDAEGADRIRIVPKTSLRAFAAYLSASWVFSTHGLYGSPPPPRHKTLVNLWHGDAEPLSHLDRLDPLRDHVEPD